jgi:hypothetical protein
MQHRAALEAIATMLGCGIRSTRRPAAPCSKLCTCAHVGRRFAHLINLVITILTAEQKAYVLPLRCR